MICPYCDFNDDKVIDSRASDGGHVIRRRRQCLKCRKRFTTYERVEQTSKLVIVKRDGRREPFDRQKVLRGVLAAFGKRPTPSEVKERIVDEVEEELYREHEREAPSRAVGELVMRKLLDIDEVAFVRFASEYNQLRNAEDLRRQLDEISGHVKDVPEQQRLF